MAIKHTMVSYYGLNYVEHAEADFREMLDHGVDTVLLAITEFDMDFWFPNINAIVKKAHEMGLRVIADTWGIGKFFGGEQVSLFLQNNIHHRQVSAYTGEVLNAACFNTNSFRDYFERLCLKLARETEVDGFFWDEPHYAYPKSYASITGGAGDDWACRCPECMKKFEDYYGYEMPKFMNDDVKQFRWREALETLSRVSKSLKEYNPKLEITCCVHATLNGYYVTELRGYDNWDMVAACPYFDVFSTTIINWSLPDSFFQEITDRTVAVAKKYGKESERWLMGYNKRPEKWEQIDHVVDMYEAAGVDRLATWTYRGGYGTSVAAKDALELCRSVPELKTQLPAMCESSARLLEQIRGRAGRNGDHGTTRVHRSREDAEFEQLFGERELVHVVAPAERTRSAEAEATATGATDAEAVRVAHDLAREHVLGFEQAIRAVI